MPVRLTLTGFDAPPHALPVLHTRRVYRWEDKWGYATAGATTWNDAWRAERRTPITSGATYTLERVESLRSAAPPIAVDDMWDEEVAATHDGSVTYNALVCIVGNYETLASWCEHHAPSMTAVLTSYKDQICAADNFAHAEQREPVEAPTSVERQQRPVRTTHAPLQHQSRPQSRAEMSYPQSRAPVHDRHPPRHGSQAHGRPPQQDRSFARPRPTAHGPLRPTGGYTGADRRV